MTRRFTAVAVVTGVWLIAMAAPAVAHGLGGRVDLPVPRWLFVFGAGTALIVSFVALSALWTEPRFEDRDPGPASSTWLQGILILVYSLITMAGMYVFGRRAWTQNGEAFAVYFGLIARISPLARDAEGRVIFRPPLAGLAEVEARPGLLALIVVALGSTTFDGLSRTSPWVSHTATLTGLARVVTFTAGMLAVIGLVAMAYVLAMVAAARVVAGAWHPLAVRFAPSLVPIVLAYAVAHYFSYLLIEGQIGLAKLSDPFGWGWDLFGTARWSVNLALLSTTLIWYVQVAAIVTGHIGGVVFAHDRAIALFERGSAVRTQFALLAVMVLFTATGLLILSG